MSALSATDGTEAWVGDAGTIDPAYPTDLIQAAVNNVRILALNDLLRTRLTRTITAPNPAAGADFTVTVPPGSSWIVQSVRAQLVTSAAVANRAVTLRIGDGVSELRRIANVNVQAASLTWVYGWLPGYGFVPASGIVQNYDLGETPPILNAGATIATSTGAIDVGDQWSGIALSVIEYTVGQVYWLSDLIARELGFETLTDLPAQTPVPVASGQAAPVVPLAR